MDTYFENQNVYTYEQYQELFRAIYGKGIRRTVIIYGIFCLILLLEFWAGYHYALAGLALMIFLLARRLMLPRREAKRVYTAKLAYYDGVMPTVSYSFYEDHFKAVDVESSQLVRYSKIEKIEFFDHSIVITALDGSIYLAAHNGFTKGTPEEFREFIRSKCPQLKLPAWKW